MVDGRNEIIRFSKSERAMADELDLLVHAFEGTVGDSEFGPCQEPGEMVFDQACKVDDRFQPIVSRPPCFMLSST